MGKDDSIEIDVGDFLSFCKKIELKDNDILVFKYKKGLPVSFINRVFQELSSVIKEKITKKSTIIIVGDEIENISQIPEAEMNRLGWFRRDLKIKEGP